MHLRLLYCMLLLRLFSFIQIGSNDEKIFFNFDKFLSKLNNYNLDEINN